MLERPYEVPEQVRFTLCARDNQAIPRTSACWSTCGAMRHEWALLEGESLREYLRGTAPLIECTCKPGGPDDIRHDPDCPCRVDRSVDPLGDKDASS